MQNTLIPLGICRKQASEVVEQFEHHQVLIVHDPHVRRERLALTSLTNLLFANSEKSKGELWQIDHGIAKSFGRNSTEVTFENTIISAYEAPPLLVASVSQRLRSKPRANEGQNENNICTIMPPRIHIIRHAQGEHNATRNYKIRDAVLTTKGKGQCSTLQAAFKYHNDIDIVFSSPLRRTIQTASLSLGPTLTRKEVPFVLLPSLQEVSSSGCDVGIADTADDVKQFLPSLFADGELPFDYNKIDASYVTTGWNSKEGYWAYEKDAILKRAADLRSFLLERSEKQIVLVTHGAFAHFLAEDWDVEDPMTGTAWLNCEHRIFEFTPDSTALDAHLQETEESISSRGVEKREHDPHVLEELIKVSSNESQS